MPEPQTETEGVQPPGGAPATRIGSDSGSEWVPYAPDESSAAHLPTNCHVLVVYDDDGRQQHILDGTVYSIGRDAKCDIRLASLFVSRRHATLVRFPDADGSYSYRILDGSLSGKPSSNGILINGRKLKFRDLENEDEITFGPKVKAIYYSAQREARKPVESDDRPA